MLLLDRLRIRTKLALLAGIPVLGALLLSVIVIQSARRSAKTAEAIGSIEDLAELSDRMRDVVSALQSERARTAWATGQQQPVDEVLTGERSATDASLGRLNGFVSSRDRSMLPPKLARELGNALTQLQDLPKFRGELSNGKVTLDRQLDFYANPAMSLVGATAALNELSDDGSLLRSISSLASAMEVKERQSLEHALLAHAFALKEFPPGSFRRLVSLSTEEQVYAASFRRSASETDRKIFELAMVSPAANLAAALEKVALESTDELNIESKQWFDAQARLISDLGNVERELGRQVRGAAVGKLAEARQAVRVGVGLTIAVLFISMLLAVMIARGVVSSVTSLSFATEKVRLSQDFSVRAKRMTLDEIGRLTDAFNEMLGGIQDRDRQLAEHREGLERLVAERTAELSARNADMRVVFDNVAQGLATARLDGRLSPERSAAFDRWFGAPGPAVQFGEHIAGADKRMSATFGLAFDQLIEDLIPMEVSLEMMPKRLQREGNHYSLEYAPIMRDEKLDGLLLMVTDITSRVHAEQSEAEQREQVKTFQRVLGDRAGFIEFFAEARSLVEKIRDDAFADDAERRRAVHTLKGNASLYEVTTVVAAAHVLEQAYDEAPTEIAGHRGALVATWDSFARRAVSLLGEDLGDRFELSKAELETLLTAIRQGVSREELESKVERLAFEPMQARLGRVATQLRGLAKRLGKPEPKVVVDVGDIRLPPNLFAPLWASFAHLIRNIVDHALEAPEVRLQAGKPSESRVDLRVTETAQGIEITVSDDGRGIDWDNIRARARTKGLRSATQADLVSALLSPGFSTAESVSLTSGRGVGLSAVATAVRALGGTLEIESTKGVGTRFTINVKPQSRISDSVSPRLNKRPLSIPPPKA
jgi:two-component system chemotaxis sensor kinase CheA